MYDHEAMGVELPAELDFPTVCEQKTVRRAWSHNGWEAALETVLQWLWNKHDLLAGVARPPSAAVNEGNRPALAAYCENLPREATRRQAKPEVQSSRSHRAEAPQEGVDLGSAKSAVQRTATGRCSHGTPALPGNRMLASCLLQRAGAVEHLVQRLEALPTGAEAASLVWTPSLANRATGERAGPVCRRRKGRLEDAAGKKIKSGRLSACG